MSNTTILNIKHTMWQQGYMFRLSLQILWALGIPQCIEHSSYGSVSWGPEDDSVRVETCSPAVTLYVLYLVLLCLTDTFYPLYSTNTPGWKTSDLSVFVALGIQHVMRLRHIVICGLPGSTIFFHIVSWTAQFSKKKKNVIEQKCLYFLNGISETSHYKKNGRDMIENVYWSSCKVTFIVARF